MGQGIFTRRACIRGIACAALALSLTPFLSGCRRHVSKGTPEITVFAAASMRGVAEEIGKDWEREHPGDRVIFNFAGSNDLAKQISATRQADAFISASEEWADFAEKSEKMIPGTREVIAHNRLIVIAPSASSAKLNQVSDFASFKGELILANPDAVPAGKYARQWLQGKMVGGNSVWDLVKEQVVPMPDVRAALGMVAQRPQSLGVVYATDLKVSDKVKLVYAVPPQECPSIRIVAMALDGPAGRERASGFVAFLRNPNSQKALKHFGFEIPLGP